MHKPIEDNTERGEYIHALWRAVKENLIDWQSCRERQADVMPRCRCGKPVLVEDMCADCARKAYVRRAK